MKSKKEMTEDEFANTIGVRISDRDARKLVADTRESILAEVRQMIAAEREEMFAALWRFGESHTFGPVSPSVKIFTRDGDWPKAKREARRDDDDDLLRDQDGHIVFGADGVALRKDGSSSRRTGQIVFTTTERFTERTGEFPEKG